VPRRLQDLGLEVGQATAVLTTRLARPPTRAEVATQVGVSEADVRAAQASAAGYSPTSLSAPVAGGDGTTELGDLFGTFDPDLDLVDNRVALARLLARLPARERRLLTLRFHGNRTQAEIAAEMGVSQMHVSRLLGRTLAWLREAMLGDVVPTWEGSGGLDHEEVSTSVHQEAGGTTVRIRGEVDRDTAGRLRLVLRQAIHAAAPGPVRIDLSAVPMADAAAVAVLLDAASAAAVAGVSLRLTGAQSLVQRVLTASGLGALIA
jgi:RNA polymerase sigma-B factor